ncbi:probable transposase (partial length) [Desulfotalea psychrophila LSv54]|uniref:Probable transposase (Partial length) n=1 Tax=Desulfotalea psychrophila (strain LSv54 / DSM 12343) TaxID=177439 RepID=Q6AID0_DESPS|nr:probable transposase (partial length) [Desulfotalea psychrophila LSv54]
MEWRRGMIVFFPHDLCNKAAVHRQFRKLTKTKGAFPNKDSLLKLLYLGIQNASKKWTMPIQNWALTISQLVIYFEGRLDKDLKL